MQLSPAKAQRGPLKVATAAALSVAALAVTEHKAEHPLMLTDGKPNDLDKYGRR